MEDFRLTAMRMAAQTVARWTREWGPIAAREMVIEHLSGIHGDIGPVFRAAYLTAFGH